jgi:polar amino acid transport system ATP-binding protein
MAEQSSDTPKLELRDVHKSFGDKPVLQGLDLTVNEHEVVCLIGPSGCGKSTILRCIDLLDPIDSGSILLDGQNITGPRVNANQVRRRIGIVFQSFNLFPHMNVLDNVTLGPRRAHGTPRREAEARAVELLERFGLGDKADAYPNRMSGGQNQRAAIVRALMVEPEVLLLDEVTSALDPELVGEVLGVIRELRDEGLTMVLATHEMGFARDVANQVVFLHEGRVLEAAPPSELFDQPQHPRTQQFLHRVTAAGRL